MIWFTSDSHFEHENVIKYSERLPIPPSSSDEEEREHLRVLVQEMNENLVKAWNSYVGPKDTVYHLGDFAFSHDGHRRWLNRLNGKKHLIIGNHDPRRKLKADPLSWKSISPAYEFNHNRDLFYLSHYAHRVWHGSHKGSYMLYGHSHGNLEDTPWGRSMDVGVDNINRLTGEFRPFSVDEVLAMLSSREFMLHHPKR